MLAATLSMPEVQSVEPNRRVHKNDCNIQGDAEWNLARIDEREINLVNPEYSYDSEAAALVDVYVIDTGVFPRNVEFQGRAVFGPNYADSEDEDCNGHGTHVSGTIGGRLYGVAKQVSVIGVKVLDCYGSGSWDGVISGVQYVAEAAQKTKKRSVANMSLGGGFTAALNEAVNAAVDVGVVFVVAAGNEDDDACYYSPASAAKAISVGATTIAQNATGQEQDTRSYFSNYGTCVDVFAPGEEIKAAWIGSTTATDIISGTSMASPHVAGVVALMLSQANLTPAQVKAQLIADSTKNAVNLDCSNADCRASPNNFLYTGCSQ